MIIQKIDLKPLSVNKAWKGRRFKTQDYKNFEMLFLSKTKKEKAPEGLLQVCIQIGVSNRGFDIDNSCKQLIDCMQRRFEFNDNKIMRLAVEKIIVSKGEEYISFSIKKIAS